MIRKTFSHYSFLEKRDADAGEKSEVYRAPERAPEPGLSP